MAKKMQNKGYSCLLRKFAGIDLFVPEAYFHKSCYHNFHGKFQTFKGYHQSKSKEMKEKQELLYKAHAAAYSEIKAMIKKQVITEHKVLPLSVFRDRYINELQEQNQPNEKCWSNNLKKKLENDAEIAPLLQLSKIESKGYLSFWLIFSANLAVEKAVAASS